MESAAHARLLSHTAHGGRGVDVAVAFQRLAIGHAPAYTGRVPAIGLLADVWLARYEKTRATADLDGGFEATLVAMRLSRGRPDRHRHFARYGRGARYAFEISGDAAHLYRGIHATKKALDSADLPDDLRASYLLQLATLTADYAEHDPDDEIRKVSRNMLFECIKIDDQPPYVLAEAGRLWADLAITAGSWTEAELACLSTLQAMWRMTGIEVSRRSQESTLARFSGMASLGAACHLLGGDPMNALRPLELGRGVMMIQDLNFYGEVHALRWSAPDLAQRLAEQLKRRDEAAAVLDSHPFAGVYGPPGGGGTGDLRRIAARNLQLLAAEVRQRFMKAATDDELLASAGHGPIVMINVSPLRSDALVVQPSDVTVVPLPALTPEAVDKLTSEFMAAAADSHPSDNETMLDGLAWLWDHLAEPVLEIAAPPGGNGPLPRLWWCPTGPLSFLPLHAVGHHRNRDGRTVLARAVSSYTPTIMALERVRTRWLDPSSEPNLLAVAVTSTVGEEDELPGALRGGCDRRDPSRHHRLGRRGGDTEEPARRPIRLPPSALHVPRLFERQHPVAQSPRAARSG